ncbi:N-acyl homoserine lactonase family protein [Kordiimonas sp. SCSIO 12603]|uniref:N-acyl homoserine lactonase family protein n=1 Tax=Kordiimonas sp. SCSIO 12603 TaxID=2829596 RepID=UPI0021027891|nr:N-acyl homoserine lactonase family protein [Kordiimonas sp. SCSIO 12603]UTW58353.1 N-acyl homoserine lactonase family protein [Kordiimonas sp. SCSIO 12603]
MKNTLKTLTAALAITLSAQAEETDTIKLYALDCGTIEMFDIGAFSSEGHFNGQSVTLADPCFLIRHPKGDFLWDTGLEQSLSEHQDGMNAGYGILRMERSLTDQLADLGMSTDDVEYLGLSHWHPDHSGNAALFTSSTLVINNREHAFMFSDEMKAQPEAYKVWGALENTKTIQFDTEHDVFGDGTVVVKYMPGHTVGHSVLYVNLQETGGYLFSGDLYTHAEGREKKAVPSFNFNKEATSISQSAFEAYAREKGARIIIQHEMKHFNSLPAFPAYEQ